MLSDEGRLAFVTEKTAGHGHGAAGIEHMDHGLAIVRGNLDGGVAATGGCAPDQQGQLESLALHLLRNVHHLVERRRYEAAEADHVSFF